jgi:hypothetical protein
MSHRAVFLLALLFSGGLAGCDASSGPYAFVTAPAARDRLLAPPEVVPGRLEYAEEPDTFAPLLTQRLGYPTQAQANDAFQRYLALAGRAAGGPLDVAAAGASPGARGAVRVRLFACRPGVMNDATGRIRPARGNEVHCATDFLDAQDRRLFRATVNFSYQGGAWRMAETAPPMTPTPWLSLEPSPLDRFSWAPWGRRTTPY